MRRAVLLSFFLTLTAVSAVFAFQKIETPPDILLGPKSKIPEISIVKKLLHLTQSSVIERGKIDYLIARVRESKMMFVRNGEMHAGSKAATHLMHKYQKRIDQVKTVQQFIDEVGSSSSMTGEPYYVKSGDGTAYRVRDVFLNELRVLDEYLAKKQ